MTGKFSKYVFYAMGEILLVVIGILIALQVNTWNELKKARTYELTMLKQIDEALEVDLKGLNSSIDYLHDVLYSMNKLARIQNDRNYRIDSLDFHLDMLRSSGMAVNINKSPYEALKSSGLDKVSNPELRKNLSDLFGNLLVSVEGWVNEVVRKDLFDRATLFNTIFPPHVVSDGAGIANKYKINIDVIYQDPQFDRLLMLGGSYIPRVIGLLERAVTSMEAVSDQITKEISG